MRYGIAALANGSIHYTDLAQSALTPCVPLSQNGRGEKLSVPLLPFWEKGLGDEGKRHLATISETFAEWIVNGLNP
ncbi:MAG: hypothetical protein NW220_18305 [Leptolyngbyaceae cyanobacterium bins.349]|nr:hypothetical protein [Leptolyngbyaceae cyanobacterium bins.349]